MTRHERHLWYDFLKHLGVMVHRQKVIDPYIVDFYIAEKKLVIELDGSQHYEPTESEKDRIRTRYLEAQGIQVLRFSNTDVLKQFERVCAEIDRIAKSRDGFVL